MNEAERNSPRQPLPAKPRGAGGLEKVTTARSLYPGFVRCIIFRSLIFCKSLSISHVPQHSSAG